MSFNEFLNNYKENNHSIRSKISKRSPSDFTLVVKFKDGGKFTYRGDDMLRKLKEQGAYSIESEIQALTSVAAEHYEHIHVATLYNNVTKEFENRVLLKIVNGSVLVDKLNASNL